LKLSNVKLHLGNPIRVIEWSGDTRGNGGPDGWELLHDSIVKAAVDHVQAINSSRIPQLSTPRLRLSAP
jgi:hypothetical protein